MLANAFEFNTHIHMYGLCVAMSTCLTASDGGSEVVWDLHRLIWIKEKACHEKFTRVEVE